MKDTMRNEYDFSQAQKLKDILRKKYLKKKIKIEVYEELATRKNKKVAVMRQETFDKLNKDTVNLPGTIPYYFGHEIKISELAPEDKVIFIDKGQWT